MQNAIDQLPVLSIQASPSTDTTQQPLKTYVKRALENYFSHLTTENNLSSTPPKLDLYGLVLSEVEYPLLEIVLQQTRGNQTKAAKLLGISRGTLRKKLKQYDLA